MQIIAFITFCVLLMLGIRFFFRVMDDTNKNGRATHGGGIDGASQGIDDQL